MKNNILIRIVFIFITVVFAGSCETDMEKAQDAYKPSMVVPAMLGVAGPSAVYQTETRTFSPSYSRAGSTWSWSVLNADLKSVSEDTRTATIEFKTMPSGGKATLTVSETTGAGVKSADKVMDIAVKPFCALNINNFVGAWDCDEAGYGVYPVNFTKDAVLANTIINDNFWDWAAPGEVIKYTFSGDFLEKITVPKQNFTFGDGYAGWVEGTGKYDGCAKTMVVDYTVYYDGEESATHHEFSLAAKGVKNEVVKRKSAGYKR